MKRQYLFVIAVFLSLFYVEAFTEAQPNTVPTCSAAVYQQFDFWLGDWEVATADGKVAGHNRIERVNRCLLMETWSGAQGAIGKSINYFDPLKNLWIQHWVSDSSIIHLAGKFENGAMVMEGTITYIATGQQKLFRGSWTQLEDGRVRQFFEEQSDDGWQQWFEGFYKKSPSQGQ